jgi:hypothetical protein
MLSCMKVFPSLPEDYLEKVQEVMVLALDPDQIGRLSASRMTSPLPFAEALRVRTRIGLLSLRASHRHLGLISREDRHHSGDYQSGARVP